MKPTSLFCSFIGTVHKRQPRPGRPGPRWLIGKRRDGVRKRKGGRHRGPAETLGCSSWACHKTTFRQPPAALGKIVPPVWPIGVLELATKAGDRVRMIIPSPPDTSPSIVVNRFFSSFQRLSFYKKTPHFLSRNSYSVISIPLIADFVLSFRANDWHGRRTNEVFGQCNEIGRGGGRCPASLPVGIIRRALRAHFPCYLLGCDDISCDYLSLSCYFTRGEIILPSVQCNRGW